MVEKLLMREARGGEAVDERSSSTTIYEQFIGPRNT